MGTREAVDNIAGSVAGVGVVAVLSRLVFPGNFLLLFVCFIAAYSVCLVWISRLREGPLPRSVDEWSFSAGRCSATGTATG